MKKYKILIKEIFEQEIIIKEKSKFKALEKVKKMYFDDEIIIFPEDLVETNFILKEVKK